MFKIIIDRKDTHVHCRLFVNHALAGNLVFQVDEFSEFAYIMRNAGAEITDDSYIIKGGRFPIQKGIKKPRKWYH